jgi:hypothetical protein
LSQQKPTFIEMRHPIQCILWDHPERATGIFEEVESYEDESHLVRSLYKCKECGQLYFYEWYEWVDWKGGNDKMYTTFIPVQTEEEIEELKMTDNFTLMPYFPRLQLDGGKAIWNGKG